MNLLIINEKRYLLPEDVETRTVVLNHLQMCLAQRKDFINLFDLDGIKRRITSFELRQYDRENKIQVKCD